MRRRNDKQDDQAIQRKLQDPRVREYEAGSSIPELRKKYGVAGTTTITRWIRKYSNRGLRHRLIRIQTEEEVNRIGELEAEVKELKEALVKVSLEKLALESILEVLQEMGVVTEEMEKNAASSSSGLGKRLASKKGSG